MNRIAIERKVLEENDQIAARLRGTLKERGTLSLNFIGSRGSGKTTLLERTLEGLPFHTRAAVLTGDIQTKNDAIRLQRYGYPVCQITAAGACHLDAQMVEIHIGDWLENGLELLLIENAGDLDSPAGYDLGEDAKVIVVSVADGEERPLKYPDVFRQAELMLLNKMDLLPHVPFKAELAHENLRRICPEIEIIEVSCTTGVGFDLWLNWLAARAERKKASAKLLAEAAP